jgi:hypothetical protein
MNKRKEKQKRESKVGNAIVIYPGVLFFSVFMQVNSSGNHKTLLNLCYLYFECMKRTFLAATNKSKIGQYFAEATPFTLHVFH